MSTATFLGIPLELRLLIYEMYLADHQRVRNRTQPSNIHIRMLQTCRQIDEEAGSLFRHYISLLHERQIHAFIASTGNFDLTQVTWADVANDGRMLHISEDSKDVHPLSQLHVALRRLLSLTHVRVFECRQGLPLSLHSLKSKHFSLQFEDAMFPSGSDHQLLSYELYLSPDTRVVPFAVLSAQTLQTLRLSGECLLPSQPFTPALRHVTLHGITGNHFDRQSIDSCFPGAQLESFCYSLGTKTCFEIRNTHLESLVVGPGSHLRKLVLLGCNRLTSLAIANCLQCLPNLAYFALSWTTVEELRTNFILSLPSTVSILKLQVTNAWYAIPLLMEERAICDTLEDQIFVRQPPLDFIAVNFRARLTEVEGRGRRWKALSRQNNFHLHIGPWEDMEHL